MTPLQTFRWPQMRRIQVSRVWKFFLVRATRTPPLSIHIDTVELRRPRSAAAFPQPGDVSRCRRLCFRVGGANLRQTWEIALMLLRSAIIQCKSAAGRACRGLSTGAEFYHWLNNYCHTSWCRCRRLHVMFLIEPECIPEIEGPVIRVLVAAGALGTSCITDLSGTSRQNA